MKDKWIPMGEGLAALAGRKPNGRQNHHKCVDRQRPETPRVWVPDRNDGEPDRADDRDEQNDPDREDDE